MCRTTGHFGPFRRDARPETDSRLCRCARRSCSSRGFAGTVFGNRLRSDHSFILISHGVGMRIAISTTSRFHMFDLAREARKLRHTVGLFAAYPSFKVDRDLTDCARTHSSWMLARYLVGRVSLREPSAWWDYRIMSDFGRWLASELDVDDFDVLDALDGTGLEAGHAMKTAGRVWICNRGSTHVLTQRELLEEEHRMWGAPPPKFDPRLIERCLAEYEESDGIAAGSQYARSTYIHHGIPESKVFNCPYGVDLRLFEPKKKEDNRFRVVFAGGQSIRKGIGYLLNAVRPLVERGYIDVWLIGSVVPDARHILDRNAGIFTHKGVQPRASLAWFYSQASVLVLPSVEDGFGMVQAQAMACGTPVIASTNTGARDLFTDGVEGFIVPARSADAIRERIEWMLNNPVRQQEMSQAALRRIQTLGGWDDYASRCVRMYESVLHRTRTAPAG